MEELTVNGMTVSPSVVNTIVAMSAKDVPGIASLGTPAAPGILGKIAPGSPDGAVDISADDDKLCLGVHIQVNYGYPLPEIANKLRRAIADSVMLQLGLEVASIDVYIDGIQFS